MKKYAVILTLALVLAVMPVLAMAEESYDPAKFIDWFNESFMWMTVANEHFSSDPADQITDEELEIIFNMAMKQQNAVHWTPYYFVVVKDVEEQKKIIGDAFNAGTVMATEGTVTILCLADQILPMEDGHVTPYEGTYYPSQWPYYDSGMTCGVLGVAANALGYGTHYFGTINGEYAPIDIAGKYQSMSRYVNEEDMRVWGMNSPYEGEINQDYVYPVAGNCVFVCAIVMGKPAEGETVETWGTNHARPNNWKIWDGVPNEKPSPSIAAYEAVKAAPAVESTIALGENEYLGVGKGNNGDVKVKVTIVDGKLTAVEVAEHQETESISVEAIEKLPAMILEAQSADVDNISGATMTADAIKGAVKDAMTQAGL